MENNTIKNKRVELLKAEIERHGLTNIAKRANKPVRQINDMASGRKSFGDKVAREIGPIIRPDLPSDWLLTPSGWAAQEPPANLKAESPDAGRYHVFSQAITEVIQIMEPLTNAEQREIVGAVKMLVAHKQGGIRHSNTRTGQ